MEKFICMSERSYGMYGGFFLARLECNEVMLQRVSILFHFLMGGVFVLLSCVS